MMRALVKAIGKVSETGHPQRLRMGMMKQTMRMTMKIKMKTKTLKTRVMTRSCVVVLVWFS
jgi:hypothetical protein